MTATELRRVEGRRHLRAPMTMEVAYRTTGSFLVSYSLNLSVGGLFLETSQLMPIGSELRVRFAVPDALDTVELSAQVVWVREPGDDVGLPPGLGLRFDAFDERLGALVDGLVCRYAGMVVLAVSGEASSRERLSRYLRNIVACQVVDLTPAEVLERGFGMHADLLVIDLDSTGSDGLQVVSRVGREIPTVPVVALCSDRVAHGAAELRVAAMIDSPPAFETLRRTVLEALARPESRPAL